LGDQLCVSPHFSILFSDIRLIILSVVFITPIAFTNIGYRTWIIFAVTNFAVVPIIYFLYPETAFRSLEEVDVIFFLAAEAPGNPWLNVVRISLNKPRWFGKKDEGHIGFDYVNSTRHRKLTDPSTGNKNENQGKKDNHGVSDGDVPHYFSFSDSGSIAPRQMIGKRMEPESPIDPMLYYHRANMVQHNHSPTHTFATTLASQHNDNSTRSLNHILARSHSSEQSFEQKRLAEQKEYQLQQRILALNALHLSASPSPDMNDFDDDYDDDDDDAILAPAPLRISRPPSGEHRPYTSDSTTHRSFHHPNYVAQPIEVDAVERPSLSSSEGGEIIMSFSYPGRLRSDGIRRTLSGREVTYWPDGIEQGDELDWREGRCEVESRASTSSRLARMQARGAGRAY
jgi:hypothetical protein